MELTKENIKEWKLEVDKLFKERHDLDNYSDNVSDSDYLEMYEGDGTPEDAYQDEVECWMD